MIRPKTSYYQNSTKKIYFCSTVYLIYEYCRVIVVKPGGGGGVYEGVVGKGDLPGFVGGEFEGRGRFGWLVERDGVAGGFLDAVDV